jgi:hypothetical protein
MLLVSIHENPYSIEPPSFVQWHLLRLNVDNTTITPPHKDSHSVSRFSNERVLIERVLRTTYSLIEIEVVLFYRRTWDDQPNPGPGIVTCWLLASLLRLYCHFVWLDFFLVCLKNRQTFRCGLDERGNTKGLRGVYMSLSKKTKVTTVISATEYFYYIIIKRYSQSVITIGGDVCVR